MFGGGPPPGFGPDMFSPEMAAQMMSSMPPDVVESMMQGAPPGMASMFRNMMRDAPGPPALTKGGYELCTNTAGTPDGVAKLGQCDEWWVLAMAPLNEDPEGPEDLAVGARCQLMKRDSKKKSTLEADMVIASCIGDYRCAHFTGECELLWRTLLSACDGPLTNMPGGFGGFESALEGMGLHPSDERFIATSEEWKRPRRPTVVLLPSIKHALALQPALQSIGIEARVAPGLCRKVVVPFQEPPTVRIPRHGFSIEHAQQRQREEAAKQEEESTGLLRMSSVRPGALRFAEGDRVLCFFGEDEQGEDQWRAGTVVATLYREEGMPRGFCAAYQVQLAAMPGAESPPLIYAPRDCASIIRGASEQDWAEAEANELERCFDEMLEAVAGSDGGPYTAAQADQLTDSVANADGVEARVAALRAGITTLRGVISSATAGDDGGCEQEGCSGLMRATDSSSSSAPLRFAVGDGVVIQVCPGDWRTGVVTHLRYSEPTFPPGRYAAYQVRLDESGGLLVVPRDADWLVSRAAARVGGRESLLHALAEYSGGDVLSAMCEQLPLAALEPLSRVASWVRPFACQPLNSAGWLRSAVGRASVRELAFRLPCRGLTRGDDIPRAWWTVPQGTMPRDTLCWGWRTNLEQAVKRGDAAMVRLIATHAPGGGEGGDDGSGEDGGDGGGSGNGAGVGAAVAVPLVRHLAEVLMFAEANRLLERAAVRGHMDVALVLLDVVGASVDSVSLLATDGHANATSSSSASEASVQAAAHSRNRNRAAWAAIARGRGWSDNQTELLRCCYPVGSPMLTFDDEPAITASLTREKLDAVCELLLERGADPNALSAGKRGVSPLFMASINCNTRLVHAMLTRGGKPDARIADGNTPRGFTRAQLDGGDGSFGAVVSLLEGTAAPLLGRAVRLHGLSRAELNGRCGRTTRFVSEKQRYAVVLDGGGDSMLVKPSNLEPVEATVEDLD